MDFPGEKRSNATHQSTTDIEAKLYKKAKGHEAKLCYLGHVLMENRNGLVVNTHLSQAAGTAERGAALMMLDEIPGSHQVTLGGDKNYDVREFVKELRVMRVTPHVTQKERPLMVARQDTRDMSSVRESARWWRKSLDG